MAFLTLLVLFVGVSSFNAVDVPAEHHPPEFNNEVEPPPAPKKPLDLASDQPAPPKQDGPKNAAGVQVHPAENAAEHEKVKVDVPKSEKKAVVPEGEKKADVLKGEKTDSEESKNPTPLRPVIDSKPSTIQGHIPLPNTTMESGALRRGVLVFVGLSILFIIYLAFKTYFRKRSSAQSMVRKYGIRTRRSDIEMTPLPLDEDDDDETVFDVSSNRMM